MYVLCQCAMYECLQKRAGRECSYAVFLDVHGLQPHPARVAWQLHVHHVAQNSVALNSKVFAIPHPRPWVVRDPRALLAATHVWACSARGVRNPNDEALLGTCKVLQARVTPVRTSAPAPVSRTPFASSLDFGVVHK